MHGLTVTQERLQLGDLNLVHLQHCDYAEFLLVDGGEFIIAEESESNLQNSYRAYSNKYGGIEIQLETTLSDRGRNAQFNIGGCELPLAKFHDPLGVGEHGRIPGLSSHHNLPEQNQIDIALGLLLCMVNYGVVKRADVEILPTTLLAVMLSSLLKLTPSGFRDKMIRGNYSFLLCARSVSEMNQHQNVELDETHLTLIAAKSQESTHEHRERFLRPVELIPKSPKILKSRARENGAFREVEMVHDSRSRIFHTWQPLIDTLSKAVGLGVES
ncbi:hypothetical protein K445DRAFT_379031 [Daldinia sp. EC12]|nr:hypothetical protein K445DRAFT_379031 [Daldinia sp. EC12]